MTSRASVSGVNLLIRGGYVLTMDLKRDGVLTAVDVSEVTRAARESLAGVLSRASA